jgi:hypothetical protein
MRLVAAERDLADAVMLLGETEDPHLPSESYAMLRRALNELREGARGYGMEMGLAGLERRTRTRRAS